MIAFVGGGARSGKSR
ncbi:hypothetical protein, partial [Halomonas sp. BM-2019]